jgi:signal peptidase II
MKKRYLVALFLLLIAIDQYIKYLFVYENAGFKSECISLVLVYNYGVAFSMFDFLAHHLKYIQIALLGIGAVYLYFNKVVLSIYALPISLLYAGGISNIIDRFIHGGVVDYIYWHCGFEFAIFNFADVIINIAVGLIILIHIIHTKKEAKKTSKV